MTSCAKRVLKTIKFCKKLRKEQLYEKPIEKHILRSYYSVSILIIIILLIISVVLCTI